MKNIVLAIGRFQGITEAHARLFDKVDKLSKEHDCEAFVYVSTKDGNKKNPLKYERKVELIKRLIPYAKNYISDDTSIKNIMDMAEKHSDKDATLHIVCGGDRYREYLYKFIKYNHTHYNYKYINVYCIGEEERSETSISATKMRDYVLNDDFEEFKKIVPKNTKDEDILILYNELKQSLGSIHENTKSVNRRAKR